MVKITGTIDVSNVPETDRDQVYEALCNLRDQILRLNDKGWLPNLSESLLNSVGLSLTESK